MLKTKRLVLSILLAFVAIVAVAVIVSLLRHQSPYNVSIRNQSGSEIDDAAVAFGDFHMVMGVVVAGGDKSWGALDLPISENATVTWKSQDGTTHRETLPLARRIPSSFKVGGTLAFIIRKDSKVELIVVREVTGYRSEDVTIRP
jgi:hypothetical protein